MHDERFFDTNVLIYAFAAGDPRSARAEALLAEGGVIGVQVLNEFTNVVCRKLGWDWPQTEDLQHGRRFGDVTIQNPFLPEERLRHDCCFSVNISSDATESPPAPTGAGAHTACMQAPLAIYEALVQASAPVKAARHAAEMLERDMATVLATKQDLEKVELSIRGDIRLLDARFDALEQRTGARFNTLEQRFDAFEQRTDAKLDALEQRTDAKLDAFEQRTDAKLDALEHRIVVKLGTLMAALMTLMVGAAGALAAFVVRT